jgi:DNA-binding transcriptional LysR family regulator
MLDDLSLFVTLVESGSFAKAAIRCDIYQSKLSRRLQTLEQNLGQILVDRSVKNTIILTEAGIILYDKLHENITRINNKLDNLNDLFKSPAGELRLALPPILANEFILPALNDFILEYPHIKLTIIYSTQDVSFLDKGFDLALTSIIPRRGDYKIRTVCSASSGLFASIKYLEKHGTPQELDDLERHKIILPILDGKVFNRWVLLDEDNVSHNLYFETHCLTYDSSLAGINLVKNHIGISPLLHFNAKNILKSGEAVQILPKYHFAEMPFYIIKPHENKSTHISLVEVFITNILQKINLSN